MPSTTGPAPPEPARDPRRPRLRTLGGLSLEGVSPSHRKGLLLLAYLAVEGRQPRERLARLFWPGSRDARNRLSVTLSRLRSVAPDAVDADDRTVGAAVRTDAAVAERALARGRVALALRLHVGPFLDGVDDGPWGEELAEWIVLRREALQRSLLRACVARAAAEAAEGRFDAAAALAAAAVRTAGTALVDPDELPRLHALLLAGGSPAAATVAGDARALGLALARDVAAARAALAAGASGRPTRHNLPRAATSFVGRETERLALGRALGEPGRRLLTLVGPGGIGKTRLALQLAADLRDRGAFPGGTWFVPLEHATEAEVPDAIAEAFGAPCPTGVDPDAHLTRLLGASATLLVLDNLEHLAGVAPHVARWLAACPGLTVLATGRQPLELASEWVVPVAGLGGPPDAAAAEDPTAWPAVALFEARGRQVDPTFRVRAEDAHHVAALARMTGGSPLALELAAAWVASMAPAAIAAEVARDRDFLRSTQHDRVDRHRSLRAVFEHSWRLLAPADRVHLAALAVFRGGVDRAGARAVAAADAAALARLTARSLLVRTADDRFDLHPLLRQYVEEKLDADPTAAAAARARHAGHLLAVAEDAVAGLGREATPATLERLETDHANLRAALAWADDRGERATLLRLATALVEFWTWRGHHREALDWFARAAAHGPDPDDPGAFARAQLRFAFLCFGQRRFDVAAPLVGAALERFLALGDVAGEARARSHLGMLAVFQGDFTAARPHYHRALALARAAGDDDLVGRVLNNLGDAHAYALEAEAAARFYEEALAVVRRLGDRQMTSNTLGSLGLVALVAGDRDRAHAALRESAALARALGITYALPTALDQLACLAADAGDGERAARLWGTASGLRADLEVPEPAFATAQLAPFRASARAQIGGRAFDAAWAAARALPRARLLSAFDAELAATTATSGS